MNIIALIGFYALYGVGFFALGWFVSKVLDLAYGD